MTTNEWRKKFQDLPSVQRKAQPFSIRAKSDNNTLAILIHGFTSSSYEMSSLEDFLAEQGIDVETVLVAGHGRTLDDLASSTVEDWLSSLNDVIERNQNYKYIFIVGYSFGANLAIHTAIDNPKITGVVSLGLPVFLKNNLLIRLVCPFFRLFNLTYRKHWVSREKAEILAEQGCHSNIPIKGFLQFNRLLEQYTKKNVNRFNKPILIIHSRGDVISHVRSSEWLFRNIKSQDKHFFILDKYQHSLIDNTRRDFVYAKTASFILEHR